MENSDIKLIRLNSGQVNEPDDPSYPFRLDAIFRPPEFMRFAFVGLFGGTEELIVRGKTREVLEELVEKEGYGRHPRLIRLEITQPETPDAAATKVVQEGVPETSSSRGAHVAYCKERALAELEYAGPASAWSSMLVDMAQHPETRKLAALELGNMLMLAGHLSRKEKMREFIEGFN